MPRKPDSGQLDLAEVFRRVQQQMLADLSVGGLFEHATSAGAATEHHWIQLFRRYLPKRYRTAPAFVIDCDGRRSRQIDIAIFDNLYSPPLFPHEAGLHVPAESVYAVFEVKPTISKQWLRDAAEKAASVRVLRRTSAPIVKSGRRRRAPIEPQPILAGLLATSSVWSAETFAENVRDALSAPGSVGEVARASKGDGDRSPRSRLGNEGTVAGSLSGGGGVLRHMSPLLASYRLDLGCSLAHGAFELLEIPSPDFPSPHIQVSEPDEALIFFMLRLLDRLRELGTAPAADFMEYGRFLKSFRR